MNETEAFRVASAAPISADSGPDDPRVLRAVEEYLAALETGRAPGRDEFLARHAGIAARLGEYLDGLDLIHRAGSAAGPMTDEGTAADDLAGAEPLGDFLLVRELGRGGMGVVYEAVQRSLNRSVALKVLPFAAALDGRQLQRFKNEAQAAAALHHPNIVPVFGVGCERGVHYYAMQLIDGRTLADTIADLRRDDGRPAPATAPTTPHVPGAPAPSAETVIRATAPTERAPRDGAYFRRVAELGIQAAEALDHAHKVGVVHRDVKPGNLMVDRRGNLWVTDFGLAHIQSDARLTMTGDLVGTLRYMSPEQALARRVVVDHRTDVYSLGATLYEILTLEPAYRGNDRQELLRQIAFEEPRPPRRLNRAIPAELATVVLGAMEKDPADRYATAKDLADDLRRFLADEPIRARPAGVGLRLRKWGRRHPAAVAALAAALMAAVLGSSVALWQWQRQRAETEMAVVGYLNQAREANEKGRYGEARPLLDRAEERRQQGGPVYLGESLRRLRDDIDWVSELDDAQMRSAQGFDFAAADRAYDDAFAKRGLEMAVLSPEDAARRIQNAPIRARLVLALDDWAFVKGIVKKASGEPLRAVARLLDAGPWRQQLRDPGILSDQAALTRLAIEDGLWEQPPATLYLLSVALRTRGARAKAEELLRQAQQRYPADFWINFELAVILDDSEADQVVRLEEALGFYRVAVALRPESAVAYSNFGITLAKRGKLAEAVAAFKRATQLNPTDAKLRANLGKALAAQNDIGGAIAAYRKALDLDPTYAEAHLCLGRALRSQGDVDGGVAAYRKAIDLAPRNADAHNSLGATLRDTKHDAAGAIDAFRKAIAIDPKHAFAHNNLSLALRDAGDLAGAIAAARKAIAIDPRFAHAHNTLGNALAAKKDTEGAIECYREAINLDPKHANAHYNLGVALEKQAKLDEAIERYREAINLDPKHAKAHISLGIALADKGEVDEAIASFRKAIYLDPKHAKAHGALGQLLIAQGRFAEAETSTRRALDLLPQGHSLRAEVTRQLQQSRLSQALEKKLLDVLAGKAKPASVAEQLQFAQFCQTTRRFAPAARFYAEAFEADAKQAADLKTGHRYDAACAAALAAAGEGRDAQKLRREDRLALRRQALTWLRAELALRARRFAAAVDPGDLTQVLKHWQKDADLAGLRDEAALAKASAEERAACERLWSDVSALLKKAEARAK